ncbi:hypothetical protein Fleli_2364 [Bernardetia litoralis DSM 6794]|uniref:Uncharacterized protein n=1 Tax=Bernardetia litoralis (strain ATCC 23117 / DSM 6794 / NBRC 15988 / NCIMB 1366 / Fx l1 / Sio-4) TaxID=880071 RepID=I4ALA1_BERLS|nr:hypothetical protein [Bernardetia litoralis]AFM04736.1 hypothetical protein Fleli_2364 [Bernardetia litoralis DSM 6794]
MTDEEINKIVNQVDEIEGMTVNERLFITDLMDLFEKAKKTDKKLAKRILLALKVDNTSIDKILN